MTSLLSARAGRPPRRRPLVPIALAALAGAALGPSLPRPALLLLAAGGLAVALADLCRGGLRVGAAPLPVAAVLAAVAGASGLAAHDAAARPVTPAPPPLPRAVEGRLVEPPRPLLGGRTALLLDAGGERILVEVPRAGLRCRPLPGARLWALGRFVAPRPPRDPGGYDRARALADAGVDRRLIGHEVLEAAPGRGPTAVLAACERQARALIDRGVAPERRAFFRTVVLGDRVPLEPDLEEAFRRSGAAHLLSLSGLHVGLLAGLVLGLARLGGLGALERRLVVALALLLYLAVAGPRVPTLRATAAGLAFFLAPHRGCSWNRLALALLVVLAWDPGAVWDPGLHLSFGTVAGILALGPPLTRACAPAAGARLLGPRAVGGRFGRGVVAGSLTVFAASAPVVALRLGQVPLATLVLGLPSVALFGLVLGLALLGVGLGVLLPELGVALLGLADLLAALLVAAIEAAARPSWSAVYVVAPGPVPALGATGLLAVAAVRREAGRSGRVPGALGLLLLAALLLPRPSAYACAGGVARHAPAPVAPRLLVRDGGGTLLLATGDGRVLGLGRVPRRRWLEAALAELDAPQVAWLDEARAGAPAGVEPLAPGVLRVRLPALDAGSAPPRSPPTALGAAALGTARPAGQRAVLLVRDRAGLDALLATAPHRLRAEVVVAPGELGVRRTRALLDAARPRLVVVREAAPARARGIAVAHPGRAVDVHLDAAPALEPRHDAG